MVLLLLPPPNGWEPYAWRYFAIFAGVIIGLILEPLPGGTIGLIGITAVTVFARYASYSAAANQRDLPSNTSCKFSMRHSHTGKIK